MEILNATKDWGGYVLVALITAAATLGATWMQNRHSIKIFNRQSEEQEKRDRRQRRVEVRTKLLENLRDQLVSIASYFKFYLEAEELQRVDTARTTPFLHQALNEQVFYTLANDFQKALLQVDDSEIREEAPKALGKFIEVKDIASTRLTPEQFGEKLKRIHEAEEYVKDVIALINKRLEELWSEDRD